MVDKIENISREHLITLILTGLIFLTDFSLISMPQIGLRLYSSCCLEFLHLGKLSLEGITLTAPCEVNFGLSFLLALY